MNTGQPVTGGAQPLGEAEFADLIDRLGPFEPAVRLAVAVSGGPDSMALCLLADRWARARGGEAVALSVDHRLRPESTAELRQVSGWLAARGIAHHTARWGGPHPSSGIQAAARAARYALLESLAAEAGVLHLALAHQMEDQAETVLMRLAKGTGVDGLAGIAAIRETAQVRLVRPLLTVPRARLVATCRAFGQSFLDDPSNQAPRFARARLRAVLPALAGAGLDAEGLAATARRAARARAALEEATAILLADAAELHPAGYVTASVARLLAAPEEIGLRALARCLATVGGAAAPARDRALDRLYRLLLAGHGAATLGGCRVAAGDGRLLIAREAASVRPVVAQAGCCLMWDGRFRVRLDAALPGGLTIRAPGRRRPADPPAVPGLARAAWPCLYDGDRPVGWIALAASETVPPPAGGAVATHVPDAALTAGPFPVV